MKTTIATIAILTVAGCTSGSDPSLPDIPGADDSVQFRVSSATAENFNGDPGLENDVPVYEPTTCQFARTNARVWLLTVEDVEAYAVSDCSTPLGGLLNSSYNQVEVEAVPLLASGPSAPKLLTVLHLKHLTSFDVNDIQPGARMVVTTYESRGEHFVWDAVWVNETGDESVISDDPLPSFPPTLGELQQELVSKRKTFATSCPDVENLSAARAEDLVWRDEPTCP